MILMWNSTAGTKDCHMEFANRKPSVLRYFAILLAVAGVVQLSITLNFINAYKRITRSIGNQLISSSRQFQTWLNLELGTPGNDLWTEQSIFDLSPPQNSLSSRIFVRINANTSCLVEGTELPGNFIDWHVDGGHGCRCKSGWFGNSCSVPTAAHSTWKKDTLEVREESRRIIQAFPFNAEWEMLEMRFAEISDVVDVFVILESNYTAYGEPKPLRLLTRLKDGMYSNVAHKILHVFLDYFPEDARRDGWIADGLLRSYIGTHGLRKLIGWKESDLFVLTDADELPSREVLLFLKWHNGYSEPISLWYRQFTYGFFWGPQLTMPNGPSCQRITFCVSLGMLMYFFQSNAHTVRTADRYIQSHQFELNVYLKTGNRSVSSWTIGSASDPAGWHCSWCLDPERIRNKLLSAQNGDFPRWGDFPEKTNVEYIKRLIGKGMWFNDVSVLISNNKIEGPKSLLANRARYDHLIQNPYVHLANSPVHQQASTSQTDNTSKFQNTLTISNIPNIQNRPTPDVPNASNTPSIPNTGIPSITTPSNSITPNLPNTAHMLKLKTTN